MEFDQDQPRKVRLPAIVLDNDGVIAKGREIIGHGAQIIKSLLKPITIENSHPVNIPFTFLTNGGGSTECEKAQYMNHRLGLDTDPEGHRLSSEHLILCHTPLRQPEIISQFNDKYVLVSGYYDELRLAQYYGYKKAVHVDELAVVFPDAVPNDILKGFSISKENLQMYKENLENRFKKSVQDLAHELNFGAIFVVYGVTFTSLTIQLFSDIIASTNGHPKGPRRQVGDAQTVKFYSCNPDLVWPNTWPTPRYGAQVFLISLQAVIKAYYGFELEIIQFGKPAKRSFDYCEQMLRMRAERQNVEITNFYMIGDTPESDVHGANDQGWTSILVRTGIFHGSENDAQYPAKYVCENLEEALKLIYRIEGIDKNVI